MQNYDKISSLYTKYETSNRGPGFVSSGTGDIGGISYGKAQFASNLNIPQDFVAWLCKYPQKELANYGKLLLENYPKI